MRPSAWVILSLPSRAVSDVTLIIIHASTNIFGLICVSFALPIAYTMNNFILCEARKFLYCNSVVILLFSALSVGDISPLSFIIYLCKSIEVEHIHKHGGRIIYFTYGRILSCNLHFNIICIIIFISILVLDRIITLIVIFI